MMLWSGFCRHSLFYEGKRIIFRFPNRYDELSRAIWYKYHGNPGADADELKAVTSYTKPLVLNSAVTPNPDFMFLEQGDPRILSYFVGAH